MAAYETVATGRAKRSTAGNRMRELLEQAHQQDDDELFAEVEDDEEFAAPQDQRDVFLEDFADTDDEVEMDEEELEREMRREERRKAKGKSNAAYNPLAPKSSKPKQARFESGLPSDDTIHAMATIDPSIDPASMAPSTLVLAMRKQRREAKRAHRSEARRSNLRASTLRTDAEITEKQEQEKLHPSKKGRRAQHETGEVRGARPMTQDELIAAALEEEERNKEALSAWIRREEEKRELRRVGRKRVRGPRWTWISRTVGKLVEVVDEGEDAVVAVEKVVAGPSETSKMPANPASTTDVDQPTPSQVAKNESHNAQQPVSEVTEAAQPPHEISQSIQSGTTDDSAVKPASDPPIAAVIPEPTAAGNDSSTTENAVATDEEPSGVTTVATGIPNKAASPAKPLETSTPALNVQESNPLPEDVKPADTKGPLSSEKLEKSEKVEDVAKAPGEATIPSEKPAQPTQPTQPSPGDVVPPNANEAESSQYTRNYLVLSQVAGGLPSELKLILGDHVEWDEVQYIPARNRPINRRPPLCAITGLQAKYRHPRTMIPYANLPAYAEIQALLDNRYAWNSEAQCWFGGEEDVDADGVEDIPGWGEAVHGGWLGGREVGSEIDTEILVGEEVVVEPHVEEEQVDEEADQEEIAVEMADSKKAKGKKGSKGKAKSQSGGKRKRGDGVQTEVVGTEAAEAAEGSEAVNDATAEPVTKKPRGKGKTRR